MTDPNVRVASPPPGSVRSTSTLVPVGVFGGSGETTSHVWLAGVSSRLPAASIATAVSVWLPSVSSVSSYGEPHDSSGAPSSAHSKSRSAGSVWSSVPERTNVAGSPSCVVVGPEIVVVGSVVSSGSSIVHSWSAAGLSWRLKSLIAMTRNEWSPSAVAGLSPFRIDAAFRSASS